MPSFINSLSGPDAPLLSTSVDARPAAVPASYTGSLSGADESLERYTPGGTGPKAAAGGYAGPEGGYTEATEGAYSSGVTRGHISIGPESGPGVPFAKSPIEYYIPLYPTEYTFFGTMPKEVMELYLYKALHMLSLALEQAYWDDIAPNGALPPDGFDPALPGAYEVLTTTPSDHLSCLQMITDTKPKMVRHMSGFGGFFGQEDWEYTCKLLSLDTTFIHNFDPEIICHADLSEFINSQGYMNGITIPMVNSLGFPFVPGSPSLTLVEMFYGDEASLRLDGSLPYDHFNSTYLRLQNHANAGKFDTYRMSYPEGTPVDTTQYGDITTREYRMWLFYLATRFIDAGCEALYMGDIYNCLVADQNIYNPTTRLYSNNASYWDLMQKIRAYAKVYARRGVVLLDSHPPIDPHTLLPLNYYYYDPNASDILTWTRQFLLDYYSSGIYYQCPDEWPSYECSDGIFYADPYICKIEPLRCPDYPAPWPGPHYGTGNQYAEIQHGVGMLNNDSPGLHPMGWYCSHLPYLLEFDYGGFPTNDPTDTSFKFGCAASPGYYDNCTWFVNQRSDLRNAIIVYTYYRVKCLDPFAHFQMPGRLPYNYPSAIGGPGGVPSFGNGLRYEAVTDKGGQQETIKSIWTDAFSGPSNWILHNFTKEDVANGITNAVSGLVFVGDDKIFYIGTDGWIYGYVHIYDTWVGVSPSAAAASEFHETIQVQALSDLVASPDGTMLLYIGVDKYIHGFYIKDIWTYIYIDFMKWDAGAMVDQKIVADGCLIFPFNDRIYYIGTYTPNGINYVFGFQASSGVWLTVSPSFSAEGVYGQLTKDQEPPANSLTYDSSQSPHRLYYSGSNGLLYYFDVNTLVDYYYVVPTSANAVITGQSLTIEGNLAINGNIIYFTGRFTDGSLWIYSVVDHGSYWTGWSPTFSAVIYGQPLSDQVQSFTPGNIVVSPNGHMIAYVGAIGTDMFICYYQTNDFINYTFYKIPIIVWIADFESLQFIYNSVTGGYDLYFIITESLFSVYHLVYQEDYCNNPHMNYYTYISMK